MPSIATVQLSSTRVIFQSHIQQLGKLCGDAYSPDLDEDGRFMYKNIVFAKAEQMLNLHICL